MYEKVNPDHPDKIADRIAGAIVDLAYQKAKRPKAAVEVLIGHGRCFVIVESSETFAQAEIQAIVHRITGATYDVTLVSVPQDKHLSENQSKIRCGDNGIFKGVPVSVEQRNLASLAREIYRDYPHDGKYILDGDKVIICQSHADSTHLKQDYPDAVVNPLGDWTGTPDVDAGATNRKLGSDMGDAVTGGGLHGKDLSKADVSVNIWCHIEAQRLNRAVEASCAIGDEYIYTTGEKTKVPFTEMVEVARTYIKSKGGFEKFAEWGLIV